MIFCGIDVGSLLTKAVLLRDGAVAAHGIVDSRSDPPAGAREAFGRVLERAGCVAADVTATVATGYGRGCVPFAHGTVTELSCVARAVHHLVPSARTVIDIGGQDSKVIRLGADGRMVDFDMNDRCAAGTGRFLEMSAQTLALDLHEVSAAALRATAPCALSHTCAVFAETEIVSLLASGASRENVIAGVHAAVATRVGNQARRLGLEPEVVFVGGVSKSESVRLALERFLGIRFSPLPLDGQLVGALGAALLAGERR